MEEMFDFESVIILKPDISEAEKREIIFRCKTLMSGNDTKIEDLRIKKLAYEIKGNKEGYYLVFTFKQAKNSISKIDDYFRKNEHILKFITVRKED